MLIKILILIGGLTAPGWSFDYNTVIDSLLSIIQNDSCELMFSGLDQKNQFVDGKCNNIQKSYFQELKDFNKEADLQFIYQENWREKTNHFGGHGDKFDHIWIYYFNTDKLLMFQNIKTCL